MSVIDLSSLPKPTIIHAIDWESEITSFIEQLKTDLPDWVGVFESDPFLKVAQSWAYRLLLERQSHNQDAQSILLAYAVGQDIDHIAATYYAFAGIKRAAGESDASFKQRVQLAPEAYASAGSRHAYEFHALNVDPINITHVDVDFPEAGYTLIAIQTTANEVEGRDGFVARVRKKLLKDRQRTSDILEIIHIDRHLIYCSVEATIDQGPDASLIKTQIDKNLAALKNKIYRPRGLLALSAINAAAHLENVISVKISGLDADIQSPFGNSLVVHFETTIRVVGKVVNDE